MTGRVPAHGSMHRVVGEVMALEGGWFRFDQLHDAMTEHGYNMHAGSVKRACHELLRKGLVERRMSLATHDRPQVAEYRWVATLEEACR